MQHRVVKVEILDATGKEIQTPLAEKMAEVEIPTRLAEAAELVEEVAKAEPEVREVTLSKGNCKVSFKVKVRPKVRRNGRTT